MSGFGEKLRREREMRGVSLEEISESTKIGTRSLRALEEEDFEKLPGGIFNKGFVRAYSRFLGLDDDQAVSDFDAAWKEHQAAKGGAPQIQVEAAPELPEPSPSRLIAIVVIVLLAVVAGAYALKYYLGTRSIGTSPSLRDQSRASSAQPPSARPSQVAAAGAEPAATSNARASQSGRQRSPAKASGQAPPAQAASRQKGSAASSSAILLEVFAHEDSWLSVSADGRSLGQGVLGARKSRTIRANKEVRLRVGNIGGVEVSFNGKPVSIDGEPKQVKELTFTREGLRR